MARYFCQMCRTIVNYGDRHPCFFYKDDDTVHILLQTNKTEHVDGYETTGQHAGNSEVSYRDIFETAQLIRNPSEAYSPTRNTTQASISSVNSVSSIENGECDEGSSKVSRDSTDRPIPLENSLHVPTRKRESDARVNHPIQSIIDEVALPEPPTICHFSIEPDGGRKFACKLCLYRTKSRSNINTHYRKHTGEKPYLCKTCGKGFARKQTLVNHLRTHTGEQPYQCDICGKRFSQKAGLDVHVRTHTSDRPYLCKTCGKGFAQKKTLINHLRTHTGEKPYKCDICWKRYSQKTGLDIHLKTHKSEKKLFW